MTVDVCNEMVDSVRSNSLALRVRMAIGSECGIVSAILLVVADGR
jgi:hypothetical protein